MKNSKESKASLCYFCIANKPTEKLHHCLNCKRPICQQCINTNGTKKVIQTLNEDYKEEQYICTLCLNKEIQCSHCFSTIDLVKFSSIENMFDYIKEMGEYRVEYDCLKKVMIEDNMLIDLFICKKCLGAIDYKKTDLMDYLALFGLTKSVMKNKLKYELLHLQPKANNVQLNSSLFESNAIGEQKEDKKISNNTVNNNKDVNVKEAKVLSIDNTDNMILNKDVNKQSDIKQESNIRYTINHNPGGDSEKYATLYKEIRNQIDIMKYCNKLHQNSIDSLSNYLEVYDKFLTEQINLNNINEDYLNRIEQDIGGGVGVGQQSQNQNNNNQAESLSQISDKQGNNSMPYNPFSVPMTTMNNTSNPLLGIPNPQYNPLFNPQLNMTQLPLFNPLLQSDTIMTSGNNTSSIPIPNYNQSNP